MGPKRACQGVALTMHHGSGKVNRHPVGNVVLEGVNRHPASNQLLNPHLHALDNNQRILTGISSSVLKPTAGMGRHSPPVI